MTVVGMEIGHDGRGVELVSAEQIAQELFNGNVSARWVLENVPKRRKLGHRTVLWLRSDVEAWMRFGTSTED